MISASNALATSTLRGNLIQWLAIAIIAAIVYRVEDQGNPYSETEADRKFAAG
jgi:hypothetical protein